MGFKASHRFARISARKVRPLADMIRGKFADEIERGEVKPDTFTIKDMPARIAKVGDLWADMRKRGRSLKQPMEKLRKLSAST